MKQLFITLSTCILAGTISAIDPITFNTQSVSTNIPINSVAAETAFFNAATADGKKIFHEDFEGALWSETRSPDSESSVVSHGITWHSSPGNGLRTVGDSDSYDNPPPYMIYATDHPVPNTLTGESTNTLYGIGFWADGTGTKGKIKVIFDDSAVAVFKRIIGYTVEPPDPPEPVKETVRLTYSKEFFGVYFPDGFNKFQLLEYAGEFDEVVLMWMRTFSFAYLPPERSADMRIVEIDRTAGNIDIHFTTTPAYSNCMRSGQ
jgi:hypothetical protein